MEAQVYHPSRIIVARNARTHWIDILRDDAVSHYPTPLSMAFRMVATMSVAIGLAFAITLFAQGIGG